MEEEPAAWAHMHGTPPPPPDCMCRICGILLSTSNPPRSLSQPLLPQWDASTLSRTCMLSFSKWTTTGSDAVLAHELPPNCLQASDVRSLSLGRLAHYNRCAGWGGGAGQEAAAGGVMTQGA